MWKNFQRALELKMNKKKGKNAKSFRIDKYMIVEAVKYVVRQNFGEEGLRNIQFETKDNGHTVVFKCRSSVWKSELFLKKSSLVKKINQRVQEDWVLSCNVW